MTQEEVQEWINRPAGAMGWSMRHKIIQLLSIQPNNISSQGVLIALTDAGTVWSLDVNMLPDHYKEEKTVMYLDETWTQIDTEQVCQSK